MGFNSKDLDRTCMRLRRTVVTDGAGLKYEEDTFCCALLKAGQMYCDKCEEEIYRDEELRSSGSVENLP